MGRTITLTTNYIARSATVPLETLATVRSTNTILRTIIRALLCQYTTVFSAVAFVTHTSSIFARAVSTARHTRFVVNGAFFDLTA